MRQYIQSANFDSNHQLLIATWRHGIGSTMVQLMACCLTVPGHYLNQCWQRHKLTCKDSLEQILFEKINNKGDAFKMSSILFRPQCFSPLPLAAMSLLCGVWAIYILTCVFRVRYLSSTDLQCWRSAVEPELYLDCLGPMHCGAHGRWHSILTRRLSHCRYFDRVWVTIGVWVIGRSWGGFPHVATVTLSWRVRNFVVIGGMRLEQGAANFGRVWGFVGLSLMGRSSELWNLHMKSVPLKVFRSGSGYDRGLGARAIVGWFCTRCYRYTVMACAKFRCDRWDAFWAGRGRLWSGFGFG